MRAPRGILSQFVGMKPKPQLKFGLPKGSLQDATIEKMGKVESVEPDATRTTITMGYLDTLSMHEMLDLAGTCCLFGVRYHISTAMKEHRLTVVIH